jgi:hypothetical protein
MGKINTQMIKKMAPVYFGAVKEHLTSLGVIRDFTGKTFKINNDAMETSRSLGCFPSDLLAPDHENASQAMLNCDDFKIMVIIYASICSLFEKKYISIYELLGVVSLIRDSMGEKFTPNDMIRFVSQKIQIDLDVIPKSIIIDIAEEDEERKANALCVNQANLIRAPNSKEAYESYRSHVKECAENILNILNKEGYVHAYPVDALTSLLILHKHGMVINNLYKIDERLPIPQEVINALSKKVFQMVSGGDISDIIGPFSDGGDN